MPDLNTERLLIRPFAMEDLQDVYRLLDVDLAEADTGAEKLGSLDERSQWLRWAVLNPEQLAKLNQPPYGDRAIVLKSENRLVGACGFVPALNPYEQLPNFSGPDGPGRPVFSTPELGLFYAVSPAYQRRGYAFEAARALVDYAFRRLHVSRIIAETSFDNAASMGVMRKLGMRIERNPLPEPPWLQVVGVIRNLGAD